MTFGKCDVCDEPSGQHPWRCEAHRRCDDCGTKEKLVFRLSGLTCDECHAVRMKKQIAGFRGKTSNTLSIVCPHCGHVHSDSWDYSEGEHDCSLCERAFTLSRFTSVTYTTKKIATSSQSVRLEGRKCN